MKLLLALLGLMLIAGIFIWWANATKKLHAQEQRDFAEANHLAETSNEASQTDPVMQTMAYDAALKKLEFSELVFNRLSMHTLPAPYYKDYSHHKTERARNYKSYDTLGFRDTLLAQLSSALEDRVLKLMVISPRAGETDYDLFIYLASKQIMALHLNARHFDAWMQIIFKDQYQRLQEYHDNGQFEKQPTLNPNPQFMLTLSKGQFSETWVNSGMQVDTKPYEHTGQFLYKQAPRQYNAAKIAKEKANYLRKYINTALPAFDQKALDTLWRKMVTIKDSAKDEANDYNASYTAFEAIAGFPFPENLKTLHAEPHAAFTMDGVQMMTPDEIIDEYKNWKVIYDDVNWMLTDLKSNNQADGRKTIGLYTTPYWVPFMATGGGNFVAMDFAPGSKGKPGQIIAFGADAIKIRYLAENLTDFLQQMGDDKEPWNHGLK